MQRSHQLAALELRVALGRLDQQSSAVLQRNNGVHLRVELFDVIEIGRHAFDTGHLPRANSASESDRVHHDDL